MSFSGKLNLEWNDFEGNISRGLRELRDEKDFFDVTFATDGDQISAHKVILKKIITRRGWCPRTGLRAAVNEYFCG